MQLDCSKELLVAEVIARESDDIDENPKKRWYAKGQRPGGEELKRQVLYPGRCACRVFFKVLKCASILIVRERERNLRAAASPPMSTWLRPRVSRRRATTTCLVSTKNKQLAIFDNGFKFRAKYVYQVDNYFSVTPKYYCWEFLHLWRFISTKGALRLPTTYDNQSHPNPIHPSQSL